MEKKNLSSPDSAGLSDRPTLDCTMKEVEIPPEDRYYRYLGQIQQFSELLTSNHQAATHLTLSYNFYSLQVMELLNNIIRQCKLLQSFVGRKIIQNWSQVQQNLVFQTLLVSLEKLPNLSIFDIAANKIPILAVSVLAGSIQCMSSLQILNLDDNLIGSQGGMKVAQALAQGQIKLVEFSASNNRLENSGTIELAYAFYQMGSLCGLNLSRNQIGKSGVKALAKAFRTNENLRRLDLHDNYFNEPQCAVQLAKGFLNLQKIKRVNLGDTSLGNQGTVTILKVLKKKKIHVLNLSFNDIDDIGVMEYLFDFMKNAKKLEFISLAGNDVDWNMVGQIKSFREDLHLEFCQGQEKSDDQRYSEVFSSVPSENIKYVL